MKASEGKLGRTFMVRLEEGDAMPEAIEKFARDNGVLSAQVFIVADNGIAGVIAPDAAGAPKLRLSAEAEKKSWADGEAVIQEVLGVHFQRLHDPKSGHDTLIRIQAPKTRVMEAPAPAPKPDGPGTVPVYLFNVELL